MAQLSRLQVAWSGLGVVGGGVSTFYSTASTPSAFLAALRGYFDSIKGLFPDSVTLVFPGTGDVFEATTGALISSWTATAPSPVVGTQTGVYAAGVGARAVWRTAGVTRNRRVRGTTFLAPLAGNQYASNGTLADGVATSIAAAGETLRAADSGSMRVYTRHSAPGLSDGDDHAVTLAEAPDAVSWLRSRRT